MEKTKQPMPPPTPVQAEHFVLLRQFGRNGYQKQATPEMREKLWEMVCQSSGVPYVDHAKVVHAWKDFITAQSAYSAIALNGEADPAYISIGIAFKKKLVASHTGKMIPILQRILRLYARTFRTREEFMEDVERLCKKIAGIPTTKPKHDETNGKENPSPSR
jgi:hypothetical protein